MLEDASPVSVLCKCSCGIGTILQRHLGKTWIVWAKVYFMKTGCCAHKTGIHCCTHSQIDFRLNRMEGNTFWCDKASCERLWHVMSDRHIRRAADEVATREK